MEESLKNSEFDFRLEWLKVFLLKHFEETDDRVFSRMLKRHDYKALRAINDFLESPLENIHDWKTLTLIFYMNSKPVVSPPSPNTESPTTPTKKSKNKPVIKGKKGKEKINSKQDLKATDENIEDSQGGDSDGGIKKKKSESTQRPGSPQTVMELGPRAEVTINKVKALVKKKKMVNQLHCSTVPMSKKMVKNYSMILICRKSLRKIPRFGVYSETTSEMPKYVLVCSLKSPELYTSFKKQVKVLVDHIESSLSLPQAVGDSSTHQLQMKTLNRLKNLALPYNAVSVSGSNYFHCFQTNSRKLYSKYEKPQDIDIDFFKARLNRKEGIRKQFTLKTIMSSPLYLMNEDLTDIFYKIRQRNELIDVSPLDDPDGRVADNPIKPYLSNLLRGLIEKLNWCLNHIETDIDIVIPPWPGIDELLLNSREQLISNTEIITKMEKKLEIWEKYIKNILNKCRSKKPKGSGPLAEYQYWFKREDQLGPLVLTFYSKNVSNILKVLKNSDSTKAKIFIEKRLSLRRYYEISRDNRDYISACIHCLEGINTAKNMSEVRKIIPEFWQNLRHLWLLSGYWAVKSNIVGFIERVQYLIVKKSIKVLEVNHFFKVPQVIGKELAVEVLESMEGWKDSFQAVKAHIETQNWEMRWEFPLHRIFTLTDYIAKLAKDFCYLSDSLKQYLDIFSTEFSKIVNDESVIENFSEKVKSLTIPLRTADFNIYDPDNDVHWNLLIESFARDLSGIEKESLQIINESFKNLRSSVYAADYLLKFQEVKSEDKLTVLLMKKFEFINIQLIKEIKLIIEFIMNKILTPPLLNYHFVHSGTVYWIRHLSTSVQSRYMYLRSINEIRATRTHKRADNCFLCFTKFCELYQLTLFVNWVYIKNQNIHNQLSGKIFRLKSLPTPFKNGFYEHLIMKTQMIKALKKRQQTLTLSFKRLNDSSSNNKAKYDSKLRKNELKRTFPKTAIITPKSTSSDDQTIMEEEVGELERFKDKFTETEKNISDERRLLLFLLHQEKQTLQHSQICKENVRHDQSSNIFIAQEEFKKDLVLGNSERNTGRLKQMKATFLPLLISIDELFMPCINSQYVFTKGYESIVQNILRVSENILNTYSEIPSHILDIESGNALKYSFHLPLCSSSTMDLAFSSDSDISYDRSAGKENPIFNRDILFEIFSDSLMLTINFHQLREKTIGNYLSLISVHNDENINIVDLLNETENRLSLLNEEATMVNGDREEYENKLLNQCSEERRPTLRDLIGISYGDILQNCKTQADGNRNSNIQWHEYISDNLLIEKGLTVNVNFEVKLFDIIFEIYLMTKLGYKLPSQFYGLCLLHKRILKDLQALKDITDRYNNTILNLTQETLSTLKVYIFEFEYILLKGLNYYSWHTNKVDQFYIQLDWKMEQITNLKNNITNISGYIAQNIIKIRRINWFKFSAITNDRHTSVKDFFQEIEELRNQTFIEFYDIFTSIGLHLKKLEFMVLNKYSGENDYLILYYKQYEEEIFKALVQNCLLNLKKFKTFIIGKDPVKINLQLLSTPNVEYNFNEGQCRYFFLRCIEKFLLRYEGIRRWRVGACEVSSSMGSERSTHFNYLEDIMKLKIVAAELIDTLQLIDAVSKNISSYLIRWEKFNILWNFDTEITVDNFVKSTDSIINKSDRIFCYYDEFISELKSCKDYINLYCVRLNLTDAVKGLLRHALHSKNILKCKLTELARTDSIKIHKRLHVIQHCLINSVNSLDDFQNVLQGMKEFIELSSEYEILVAFISKVQYILVRHGLRYPEDDRKKQKAIQDMYSIIQKLSKYRLFIIKPSFDMYKKMSEKRISIFAEECTLFAENYYIAGPGSVGTKLDEGFVLLKEFRKRFNDLNTKRISMIQAENLFGHTPQSYQIFDEAFEEFQLLEVVYSCYENQKDAQEQWGKIPWIYFDSIQLESGINELLLEFENLPVAVRKLAVSKEVWRCMKNFKDSIPLMVEMKTESVKQRHWEDLMLKTGHRFEMLPSKFTLQDMIDMKLHTHKHLVNDIIGRAMKELSIENNINFVKQFWNSQKLKFILYSKQIVLGDTCNLLLLLDDYCINLHRMADSQFAHPFLEEIKFWEKQLAYIRETINELSNLQTKFLSLKHIFSNRSLQKSLSNTFKQCEVVDKDFTKLMNTMRFKRHVIEQTVVPGLLENVLHLLKLIEDCRKQLSNFLNSNRNQFPRLFLLQDDEVISIMGSKNPRVIQDIIPKIYFNLKDATFKKNNSGKLVELNGILSCENEVLIYKTPVQLLGTIPSWMAAALEEMNYSTKYMTKMAIYSFATIAQSRIEWIYEHLSTCILASIKVWWTLESEETLRKMEMGEMQAMKRFMVKLNNQLNDTFLEITKPLKSVDRMKFRNVILTDLHGRDVLEKLSNSSIMSINDFEWESQIKFYWKKQEDSLIITQCLEQYEYGFEYMGIGRKLVITPLTERVYIGLTQAIAMWYGGALTGPASTGKTETVRDLAKMFGMFCIFINCCNFTNRTSFKEIFKALCQDGIWGCFDEFNITFESVLTEIWKSIETIRTAMIKNVTKFMLHEEELNLKRRMRLFMTMNPGFSGNGNLSHSIRLLFRPIPCISAHTEYICQAMLFSEGFLNAKLLAKKMVRLYELAQTQLSQEGRYDFGLRSMKSLLLVIGDLKRKAPDMEEIVVVMRAVRDSNRSKLFKEDEIIFLDLIHDLFPGVNCPPILYPELEKAVATLWADMDYTFTSKQASKVVELYESLELKQSAIVVGPTGGGKTVIINTVCQALSQLGVTTSAIKVNPKAMPLSQLFGHFKSTTQNWTDGLFFKLFKEINKKGNRTTRDFIIFDGDIDPIWTENINSVMDDNRQLTLTNCERIVMSENCRLLFETGHIENVSPGFISRNSVIYVDPKDNNYRLFWRRWLPARIDESEMELLNTYFEKYIPVTLELLFGELNDCVHKQPLKTAITRTKLNLVVQLCFMIDALLPITEKDVEYSSKTASSSDDKTDTSNNIDGHDVQKELQNRKLLINTSEEITLGIKEKSSEQNYYVESIFIQAVYISLGAVLLDESLIIFDLFVKKLSNFNNFDDSSDKKAMFGFLPTKFDTLFDYCADINEACWIPWSDLVEPYIHEKSKQFDEIIVPTRHSCKLVWLMNIINKMNSTDPDFKSTSQPLLIVGGESTSKSTTIKEFTKNLDPELYMHCTLGLSFESSTRDVREYLESFLIHYTPDIKQPKDRKKMIMFLEDLNRPQVDPYGSQECTAFVRMLIENGGLFSGGNNLNWISIKHVFFYATMTTTNCSRENIDPRFLSLFSPICTTVPNDDVISNIYFSILQGHMALFDESIQYICQKIIEATIEIYKFAIQMLKPTPMKFHYTFNLRDFAHIVEGLLQTSPPYYKCRHQFLRVWRNEVVRILCDRLISQEDESLMKGQIKNTIMEYFGESADYVMRDPLLFGDYRNAMQPGLSRDYEDLLDYEAVYHLFTEILEENKKRSGQMSLVLFEDALDHLTRIHRVLRMYRGHGLVVGPIGSGKQSLVKLASYTAGCNTFSIRINRGYDERAFRSDMQQLYRECGIENKKTTFIVNSHQIISDSFLEIINTILVSGNFVNIFSEEEKHLLTEEYASNISNGTGSRVDRYSVWMTTERNCIRNLHIVLLMTHFDEELRKRYYKFPGLINNTHIDWIHGWPSEALYAVARRHLKDALDIPSTQKEALVDVIVFIHKCVTEYLNKIDENEQFCYITPRHFLDVIHLYITLLNKNISENDKKCRDLENAIAKLNEARQDVEEMQKMIVLKKTFVEDKRQICRDLRVEILNAGDVLDNKKKQYSKLNQEMDEMKMELKEQMEEMEAVLTRAMNDIDKAQDAVRDLNLHEISSEERPSEMTVAVFECLLILLDAPLISWQETRNTLNDPSFLSHLEQINLNTISILQQKQIRSRLKKINKVKVMFEEASAEFVYLHLVEAILNYCSAFRETKPKQERISQLESEIRKCQSSIDSLNEDINDAEKFSLQLNVKYTQALSENEKEEAELNVTLDLLEAADTLLNSLREDNEIWADKLETERKRKGEAAGRSLMSAAFLVYAGSFSSHSRRNLFTGWLKEIRNRGIPIANPFKLEDEFADDILLNKWRMELLADCEWTHQNAILLANSPQHAFCIDPQKQALLWILKQEEENNLTVLTFEDSEFNEKISMSVKAKLPILIKNIEFLDPAILDVMEELLGENGVVPYYNWKNQLGGPPRLYMTTKFKEVKFDPMVFSRTTVINFEISLEEIEDMLLNIVTESEQNDAWNHMKEINKGIYFHTSDVYDLKQTLLQNIGAPEHRVLQNAEHIKELHEMKLKIYKVQSELKENNLLIRKFEIEKKMYRGLARCGAVLYLVMNKLKGLNILYQCSLRLYISTFIHILQKYETHPISQNHMEDFKYQLKKYIWHYGCRGVFSCHKLLIPLLMAIELEKSDGRITQKEIQFFISGSGEIDVELDDDLPPISWLTKKGWNDLKKLSHDFQDFGKILENMVTHANEWEEWFRCRKAGSSKTPSFLASLKPFQKIMLLRCLYYEDVPQAITYYISESLGEEFSNLPYHSLNDVFEDSQPLTPIILITEPGFDVLQKVMNLAEKYKISNVRPTDLSSAKIEEEIEFLQNAISSGEWLLYYNLHSNNSLCQNVEHILQSQLPVDTKFRLWLITDGKSSLPMNILQISNRVVIDTPDPLKLKLRKIYEEMDIHTLESSNHPSFKPILYVTSFFHSVVQERKKFGEIGWNMKYDFGHQDFCIAIEIIKKHLANAIYNKYDFIPWKFLRFLIGEVVYGGYILDECDRRLILTYLDEYFDDSLFGSKESFKLYHGNGHNLGILPDGNKEDYIAEIEKMDLQDSTCVLGLHRVNTISYNRKLTASIMECISVLQGNSVHQLEIKKEDEVIGIIERIENLIPEIFDLKRQAMSVKEKKSSGPKLFVLIHELEAFNSLIATINTSLTHLTMAIKGEIKMEEELARMFNELYNGLLPNKWSKLSRPSCETLSTWIRCFHQRVQQYKNWVIGGELAAIWLGGLQFPKAYLASLLQEATKKRGWPLEDLVIKTEITTITDYESVQDPPELGCYISGLFLRSAKWDSNKKCIKPLASDYLYTRLPILWIVPAENFCTMLKDNLKIPVYESVFRSFGMENIVFKAELSMSIHKNKCILEGVCMLLHKD